MTALVTRAQMVDWMNRNGGGSVTKRPRRTWRRVETVIANQGDGDIAVATAFHLFEVALQGSMRYEMEGVSERSDRSAGLNTAHCLNYQPAETPLRFKLNGLYTLQQVYIDDTVFRDVAHEVAPGDPDNVEPLAFQGVYDAHMRSHALRILEEARAPSGGGEAYVDHLAQEIALAIVTRRLNGAARPSFKGRLSDAEVSAVIDFMMENLERPGGLDVFAELLDMNVTAFSRGFRAATGATPHQTLIGLRLDEAKRMLENTNQSIAEIAYACGFSSQAHMTEVFSRRLAVSPGRCRREMRP